LKHNLLPIVIIAAAALASFWAIPDGRRSKERLKNPEVLHQ
jgi:hypothetical protein